jgi:hypothetical protein
VAALREISPAPDGWRLSWRRGLFEWEKLLVTELLGCLAPVVLSESEDSWGWLPDRGAVFTFKSTYNFVFNLSSADCVLYLGNAAIFTGIWKCPAPSKVSGFIWQLLHGKIPTRNNLAARQIIEATGDATCALCGEEKESELHLFLYCEIAMLVWMDIFLWSDVPFCLSQNLFSLIHCFRDAGCKKIRHGMTMISASVFWNLWKCRNLILFDNGNGAVTEIVEAVKISSWKWWMSRSNAAHCLLYEWRAEPRLCMIR